MESASISITREAKQETTKMRIAKAKTKKIQAGGTKKNLKDRRRNNHVLTK
jgi:hypothetical protein